MRGGGPLGGSGAAGALAACCRGLRGYDSSNQAILQKVDLANVCLLLSGREPIHRPLRWGAIHAL